MISLIVARARNGAIGRGGEIPWHVPEDLKLFQRETTGGAIVMGRHTWNSLPFKPLKHRLNIVVSRDPGLAEHVVPSVEDAVALASAMGHMRIYGIGGGGIYRDMLDMSHRLLITEVDLDVEDADAFFPVLDESQWREVGRLPLQSGGLSCTARELLRR